MDVGVGAKYLVLGTKYLVCGTKYLVHGTKYLVVGTRCLPNLLRESYFLLALLNYLMNLFLRGAISY